MELYLLGSLCLVSFLPGCNQCLLPIYLSSDKQHEQIMELCIPLETSQGFLSTGLFSVLSTDSQEVRGELAEPFVDP